MCYNCEQILRNEVSSKSLKIRHSDAKRRIANIVTRDRLSRPHCLGFFATLQNDDAGKVFKRILLTYSQNSLHSQN